MIYVLSLLSDIKEVKKLPSTQNHNIESNIFRNLQALPFKLILTAW